MDTKICLKELMLLLYYILVQRIKPMPCLINLSMFSMILDKQWMIFRHIRFNNSNKMTGLFYLLIINNPETPQTFHNQGWCSILKILSILCNLLIGN